MSCRNSTALRVALVVIGLVLIVAGIIAGHLIIKKMKTTVEESNCVTSKDDKSYKNWAGPTKTETSLYYWHIKNKEGFLYDQDTPQLEERGPYVYTTSTEKVNVTFDSEGRVSFKDYQTQTFDGTLTKERCPQCKEHDKITMLNIAYVKLMEQKGDAAFSLVMIPTLVSGYMQQLNHRGNRSTTLASLGNTQLLAMSKGPAFGPWIGSHPVFAGAIAAAKRGGQSYNVSEVEGLYNVLTNSSLFLPPPTLNTSNILATGNGFFTYLFFYVQTKQATENMTSSPIKTAMEAQAEQARVQMNKLLCPHPSKCFVVDDFLTAGAVLSFVSNHLAALSMAFLENNNYGLVVTRPQSEFASEYVMEKLPLPPYFPNGIPIPGILTNHSSKSETILKGKTKVFYTCASTTGKPNTWAGFDGKTTVPSLYYPNAPQTKISGYATHFASAADHLSPCTDKYPVSVNEYDIFLNQMFLHVKITFEKSVNHHGIVANRYLVDKKNVQVNNVSVFKEGIIDLHNQNGFPIYSSLAGFFNADQQLYKQLAMTKPTFEKYGSFVDIEPITGRPISLKYRLQVNSVVKKGIISASRFRPYNITFYNSAKPPTKYFPLYWIEQGLTISAETAGTMKGQLFLAFRLACGFTIALPVIGAGILLAGCILIALAVKKRSNVNSIDEN